MKKKKVQIPIVTIAILAVLFACAFFLLSCSKADQEVAVSPKVDSSIDETPTEEPEDNETSASQDEPDIYKLLSNCSFTFSSGAGGWWTELSVEENGHFTGHYQDSDMGDSSDEYPYGTMYNCDFEGDFTDLEKIDEFSYRVTIENVTLDGTSGIVDGINYITIGPYGIDETDTLLIYLPGTPLSSLNEEQLSWLWLSEEQEQLAAPIIVNEANDEVFQGYFYDEYESYDEVLSNYYSRYGLNDTVGYLYQDFDGDGNEELIIGDNSVSADYGHAIYDMYASVDGTIKKIFSSDDYVTYYLVSLTDDDPGSAFASYYRYADMYAEYKSYHFDGERIVCDQAVRYSANADDTWMMGWETEDNTVEYTEVIDELTGQAVINSIESSTREPNYTSLD